MRFSRSDKMSALSEYTNLHVEVKKNDFDSTQNTSDEAADGGNKLSADISIRSSTSDITSVHRHQLFNDTNQTAVSSRIDGNGGDDEQFIVESESFRVHHSNRQASPGIRFSFMRTYSHTQQGDNNRFATTSNSISSRRAGSFGSSATKPRSRRTKTVLFDEDFVVRKTRRISTPDLINRRHLLRQKSLESLEQLRTLRESIHMRNERTDSLSQSPPAALNDDLKTTPINNIRPARKLSNFFRKMSLNTSKSLKLSSSPDSIAKRNHNNNNNKSLNEQDILVVERDRALEEWSESAKKCEELIDELDITLSELITVSNRFKFFFSF